MFVIWILRIQSLVRVVLALIGIGNYCSVILWCWPNPNRSKLSFTPVFPKGDLSLKSASTVPSTMLSSGHTAHRRLICGLSPMGFIPHVDLLAHNLNFAGGLRWGAAQHLHLGICFAVTSDDSHACLLSDSWWVLTPRALVWLLQLYWPSGVLRRVLSESVEPQSVGKIQALEQDKYSLESQLGSFLRSPCSSILVCNMVTAVLASWFYC